LVTLDHRLDWSGNPRYDLAEPGDVLVMYQTVLKEATTPDDLGRWLDAATLQRLWTSLWLPPGLRALWEERFPGLASPQTRLMASCEDIDLFTVWDRRNDFALAVEVVVAAYRDSGYQVEVAQLRDIARLFVTAASSRGQTEKVELARQLVGTTADHVDIGPVLHPDDVAADKMSALYAPRLPRRRCCRGLRSIQPAKLV
jgi:hypothetical protein